MLSNYLKISFRSLWRQKALSLLNIGGLALGIAVFALMSWHVIHELSFDNYHSLRNNIYRLAIQVEGASYENGIAKVAGTYAGIAKKEIPEVVQMARFVKYGQVLVSHGEQRVYEAGGFYADSTTFQLFDFPLQKGAKRSLLSEPNSIVVTQSFARRYFGDEDPMGKSLTFDNATEMRVTGAMDDVPVNSHFRFDFLVSMSSWKHPQHDTPTWWQYYTYLLLADDAAPGIVALKFKEALSKTLIPEDAANYSPFLQPLTDIHLKSDLHREIAANSNMTQLWIFGTSALFILLIACINFVNLTTAFAVRRTREVGVRKVTGAYRGQLVEQFLTEALVTTFIAVLLASQIMTLLAPVFADLTGSELELQLSNPSILSFLAGTWLLVGLTSGMYPAFFLSAFKPVVALKGNESSVGTGGLLRKGLVIFQFALSSFLIIAALTMYLQNTFLQNKDLGFHREHLVVLNIRDEGLRLRTEAFKESLLRNPGISKVTASGNMPGGSDYGVPCVPEGVPEDQVPPIRSLVVDHDFIETFGMEIAEGRDFSRAYATDSTAYLINEEAARQLAWDSPLEHSISMPAIERPKAPVIGVVRDFNFHTLHESIGPLMFFIPPQSWLSYITVRIKPSDISGTLGYIEKVWNDFDPNHPFVYQFMDEAYGQMYAQEQRTGRLANAVSMLAIFIACLGLFGLAVHSAQTRTKEIGIRKVLGATTAGITGLLTKDFLKLVAFSLLIAMPVGWYFMNEWLENFAYRIELKWWVFGVTAIVTLGVAFLTVSFQSIKAALSNPVKSLRSE